ncbi:ABC transporter substrate-binding protein [Agathobaculum sp. NTUH-O15-33]|uniref:ABC transporter substrate-binding protein n=1 Tax=Agathobaculum sp. NTUH-O15-33 TaxID=3079302 RepID=UPI0029585990|nr:ABC transporter substrate-binding protein [Agathobaculum sp. NTUH-O15-33]WNX84898.1 ABC transporter substrate-binding protein [Agathobaculum sp. NTUH-O15-33]
MKKRFLAALMCGAMALSLTACGSGGDQPGADDTNPPAEGQTTGGKSFNIGICQLLQHDALDAATKGFQDKLTELAQADGNEVKFDYKNASNDVPTCSTIINGFVSSNVDLILANASPALSAAASATDTIPILGTSITDYGTALDMDWTGTSGRNISGTADLAPLDEQAAMLHELFPDAKNVGLLYCSSEANSAYQISVIQPILEEMGYTCTVYTFSDSNDLASVATNMVSASDVIYVPTDNTVAGNTEIIKNITLPAKVPVVAGEEGICKGCGVATLSISYDELGRVTGEMAYDILVNGADISTMEVKFSPTFTKKYNKAICDELGITIPDGYEPTEEA